jgi:WD40 repeat protein
MEELENIRQRLKSTSSKERIDALLDAFELGELGIKLIATALEDRNREVRQAAFILLSESDRDIAKQALWNYLPFGKMQCLHTLTKFQIDFPFFYNPEPERFAIADYNNSLVCYWSLDYKHSFIHIWDLASGESKQYCNCSTHEFGLAQEGRILCFTYQDWFGKIKIDKACDVDTKFDEIFSEFSTPTNFAFSICPTKDSLVAYGHTTNYSGELKIVDYETNTCYLHYKFKQLALMTQHFMTSGGLSIGDYLQCLSPLMFTPDGRFLIAHFRRHRRLSMLQIWDKETGQIVPTMATLPPITETSLLTITSLAVCPDDTILAGGIRDGKVCVWELLSDSILYNCSELSSCVLSSDGRVLIYSTANHEIIVYDLVTQQKLSTLQGHSNFISHISLSRDREFIASYSIDETIKIWGIPSCN